MIAITATVKIDSNRDLWLGHDPIAHRLCVVFAEGAPARHAHLAHKDLDPLDVEPLDARASDRGEYPSPVWVAGEKRGLDQRGLSDSKRRTSCFQRAGRPAYVDGYKFGRALTVANDSLGQTNDDLQQCRAKARARLD